MPSYPTKLVKYLEGLSAEEAEAKKRLFDQTLAQALSHGFQSARFWAMRQIVSNQTEQQIQQKIKRRVAKQL